MREKKVNWRVLRRYFPIGMAVLIVLAVVFIVYKQPAGEEQNTEQINVFVSSCGLPKDAIREDVIMAMAETKNISTTVVRMSVSLLAEAERTTEERWLTHLETCECISNVTSFQNGNYSGELTNNIPSCVFNGIPKKPYNFAKVSSRLSESYDLNFVCLTLGEEYWKNPDYYWNGGGFYSTYMTTPFGISYRGYSGYPVEQVVSIKAGDSFWTCSMIHTSWGISSYQAIAFRANSYGGKLNEGTNISFKQEFFSDGTKSVPMLAADGYFTVSFEPAYLLLEPTYPYLSGNWTQKVMFSVKVADNTPVGKYIIRVSPYGTLPEDVREMWKIKYTSRFVDMVGFEQPILLLGVEVT